MESRQILVVVVMSITLVLMLTVERTRPARQFQFHRGWLWIGLGVMVVFITVAQLWSLVVPGKWLRQHRLLNGEDWGVIGGIAIWFPSNTLIATGITAASTGFLSCGEWYISYITVWRGWIFPAHWWRIRWT